MKFRAHEFKWFHSRKQKSIPILTVTWTSFSLSGTYHGWPMRGWKAYQYFIPTEKMDSTVRYTRKISRKVFMRLVSKRFNCYQGWRNQLSVLSELSICSSGQETFSSWLVRGHVQNPISMCLFPNDSRRNRKFTNFSLIYFSNLDRIKMFYKMLNMKVAVKS